MAGDAARRVPDASMSDEVRDVVRAEVADAFGELKRFMDRRMAELSSEIHATVQMVGFSEHNLTGQLDRMHAQLSKLIALPSAATRNSGFELEAVVQATEEAANRILGAAEAIRSLAMKRFGDHPAVAAIVEQTHSIFEACSFQDLTGQRIRRAIDQLQSIEGSLAEIVEHSGQAAAPPAPRIDGVDGIAVSGPDLGQSEIDKLLGK
jgi:chemotaxis protein CheZ